MKPAHQQGVALLDVLIALLLLGLGAVALVQLQAVSLLQGGHSRSRAAAAQLADEKLEDLRQFSQLPAGAAGVFGFDQIANNSGGRENVDGSWVLPAADETLSDVTYHRSWSVSPYSWCTGSNAVTPGVCPGARRAGWLEVEVDIQWTDADGAAQSLSLQSAIAALDPALAGGALIRRPTLLAPVMAPN